MRRYYELAAISALFLMVTVMPASAGSINQFSNVKLVGVSNTTASGAFSFDGTTHQFSNISISFTSSVFGNIKVSDPNSITGTPLGQGQWSFIWWTWKNGNLISYSIIFNTATNQFTALGGIANFQNQGKFNYLSVPESGTPLSYLMLSAIAVFGGLVISGTRRRSALAQSS
jgi:hypothetical protein